MSGLPDREVVRRITEILAAAALTSGRRPLAVCGGVHYEVLTTGDKGAPAYRRSPGSDDPGQIITTWPDGSGFQSEVQRDAACLHDAVRAAYGDLGQGEARALVHEAPAGIDHGAAKRASTGAKKAKRRTRSR